MWGDGSMNEAQINGPWDLAGVDRFLRDATIPVRVAAQMDDGFPVIVSLWFQWDGTHLWCATHESAKLLRHLRRQPRVAFEVAPDSPPYHGVRGQALAEIGESGTGNVLLEKLLTRYLGGTESELAQWLLGRDGEVTIRLKPVRMTSWDYRGRMG